MSGLLSHNLSCALARPLAGTAGSGRRSYTCKQLPSKESASVATRIECFPRARQRSVL